MIDQFAIFTPQGQLLFGYNALKKRFSESQINRFINELISKPIKDVSSKYPVISTDQGSFMYCELKHPRMFFVVSFASSQSLELVLEAESLLSLGIKLWESLKLDEWIIGNLSGKGKKNDHNYRYVFEDGSEKVRKFETYFETKYEAMKKELKAEEAQGSQSEQKPKPQLEPKKTRARTEGKNVKSRKWGRDGIMEDTSVDSSALDFSEEQNAESTPESEQILVNGESFGKKNERGEFLISEIDELLATSKSKSKEQDSQGSPFAFLQKHLLGNKTISESDLKVVLEKLKQKLISKNVAPEVADYLCSQVSSDLIGCKTANWTSVDQTARISLQKCLSSILTPSITVDLLHEIQKKISTKDSQNKSNPYVFSVVGVNGVGKSTNLSKLAFWLLKNDLRVLIVACDTFRSGAVEQLRVHVENLAQLTDENHVRGSKNKRGKSGNEFVELFEGGYGGSNLVTKIAKQAIKYAKDQHFDVVLMDTAGRRHNDATLMSPLKSFAEQAKPDKIIMVGEALVGTDSVQQAKNFNQAFGKERNLDFFIISKCDTVGELLGTMVNMVYATSIPILFVGVGQTYTDLRTLSVEWAVNSLLS